MNAYTSSQDRRITVVAFISMQDKNLPTRQAVHNGSVSCFGLRPAGWFSITVPTFVWLVECFAARRARRTGRRGLIGE